MQNLPGLPQSKQILLQTMSQAVTEQVIADVQGLRANDGAGLSDLIDDAFFEGIDRGLSIVAQAHACAVLGAERSARASRRAGYRLGTCAVRMGSSLGVRNVALVNCRGGLLRADFLKDVGRFTAGVKELAVRLRTHGLSHRVIAEVSFESLRSPVGRAIVGAWVQETEE